MKATSNTTAVSTRRRFLSQAAGVAAGGTALALATIPPAPAADAPASALEPLASSQSLDDSELLHLEKEIFAARDAAKVHDDETIRLHEIWQAEMSRLNEEVAAGRSYLTPMQRFALVRAMPECEEYERLAKLQQPHHARQDEMTERMFSIPATTAEGRRAKVSVLLGTLMEDDWLCCDDDSDYPIRLARKLLIEFIGGQPGEQLRDQLA